jgi:hypothetical protein
MILSDLFPDVSHLFAKGIIDDQCVSVLEMEFAVEHVILGKGLVVDIGDQQVAVRFLILEFIGYDIPF